jgi:Tfp pilus assembly protein PilX
MIRKSQYSMFKKLLRSNKGMALPMALALLVIVGFMVIPVVSLINTNAVSNINSSQAIRSYYSADAGVNFALWKIKYDTTDTSFQNWVASPTGSYNLTFPETTNNVTSMSISVVDRGIDPNNNNRLLSIESQATNQIKQNNSSSNVTGYTSVPNTTSAKAYLSISAGSDSSSVFHFALATLGGDLNMSGSSAVDCIPKPPATTCHDGDVWVGGNINMAWSNSINGVATVSGNVNSPNPNPSIYGGVQHASAPARPTWLDDQTNSFIATTVVSLPAFSTTCTSWTDVAAVYNNPICINGDMNLSAQGTYRFKDTVRVKGNLNISSGVNNVIFEKSVRVDGYCNFAGNGTVIFMNNSTFQADSIAYAQSGQYTPQTISGTAVGIASYSSPFVQLTVGVVPSGGSISAKVQHADAAGGPWTDVSGASWSINNSNDERAYSYSYTGTKPYLRGYAVVAGATCPFGMAVGGTSTTTLNNILSIGKYLSIGGSRSAEFDGKVSVDGTATISGYSIQIGGSKYSGCAYDVTFRDTIRATGAVEFGSGRTYIFSDVVYTTGNLVLDGNAGTLNINKAVVSDGQINCSGSASFGSDPLVAPFLISRKIGCCTSQSSCSASCDGVCLSGSSPVTAIIYAPDSRAYVANSASFNGAMVAKCAQLDGNVRLKYPVVLDDRTDITHGSGGGSISIVSYSSN